MFNKGCWPSRDQLTKHSANARGVNGDSHANGGDLGEDRTASCSTPRVHQLWSYLYCIVLCLIQTLLVYRAALTIGEHMSVPHLSTELYGYTVAVALSITIALLAIVASLFRLGNFSNDGDKLGKVIVRIQKNRNGGPTASSDSTKANGKLPFWRRCWQRAAPFAPTCHLIAAFLLLIPRNLLLAKSLAHGGRPELATATEIDIFMRRKTTRLDLYLLLTLSPSSSSSVLQNGFSNSTWPLQQQQQPSFVLGSDRPSALLLPSAEWANYILAAVIFASRYPAVFWYTNKSIGLFFVVQQLLSVVNYATSHAGFVLLFNLSSMAKLVPFDFLLHPIAVFLLYIFSLMVILASSMIVFEYGYEQYLKQIRTYQKLVRRSSAVSQQQILVSSDGHHRHDHDLTDGGADNSTLMAMSSAYSWRSYCSNIAAVVALICLTASKVPLVYDYMTIYRLSEDNLVFVCLISDAIYFFFWILIWFIFTLKQNWTFLIQHPFIYFRDVAIDSTDSNKTRNMLAMSSSMYQSQNRLAPDNASTMVSTTAHQPRRHHSTLSRCSSPTRSLMDIPSMNGPLLPGYGQQNSRLSRPMSALVNPQIANGLSSPSLPSCKAGFDGHGPTASSTLHIYRQSMREKNTSHFYRGGTLAGNPGLAAPINNNAGVANDPKRRSLPARHYSALNSVPLNSKLNNGMSQPISESVERQTFNGWGLTSSGTATDIIPEDAPVDSFKPHVPLKLSASSTCYQFNNGQASQGLHESRSDFLLMNSSNNGHYIPANNQTTASFASIPSIIKKRPAPPPRQTQDSSSISPQNEAASLISNGTSTHTSSSASQV